jgi:tetratricopeptide (TPR) repeat protein
LLAIAVCALATELAAQSAAPSLDSADSVFKAGKFADAERMYAELAAKDPHDETALRQLGYIALLGNQLDTSQKWLEKAIAQKPDDLSAKVLLAEVYYRRDQFPQAAAILNEIGPSYKSLASNYKMLVAPKLASFKGLTPYEIHGKGEATTLKFIKSEPLPMVTIRVNGSPEATFFIDTGGAELLLDTDFAHELGLKPLGSVEGTFSGGEKAEVVNSKVDTVTLGDWTVSNLPVAMMPLRQMSSGFGVKQLDGCIGTNVLYHFLATLDFVHGQLVLRKKNSENLEAFKKAVGDKAISVPIWMASDHFMISMGQVNQVPPALLFVDTGLAGAGIKLGETMIKKAGIKLDESKASKGIGGGGALKIVPYSVDQVSFGDIKEEKVPGLFDGPFPWENSFGFYLAGMVGHDFFKPYALTFDFDEMRIWVQK